MIRPGLRPLSIAQSVCSRLRLLIVLISCASAVLAQPGDQRTPEEKRRDVETSLLRVEAELRQAPEKHYLFEEHGKILTDLIKFVDDRTEQESLANRAFADFESYERFTKQSPLESIAKLHETLWRVQTLNFRRQELTFPAIEAAREDAHFRAAVEAYEELIRLRCDKRQPTPNDCRDCQTLAYMYLTRAQMTATPATAKAELNLNAAWLDFDKAIEYEKQYVGDRENLVYVTDLYLRKAEAALDTAQYQVAVKTYEDADDFLKDRFERYCEWAGKSTCEYLDSNYRQTSSIRKAEAYLRTGDYEKAVANADYYLSKGPLYGDCRRTYLLRAQANRKLGNEAAALADEKLAAWSQATQKCREDRQP